MGGQQGTGLAPTRKMGAAGAAGMAAVIVVWVAGLLGLDVPAEVATAFAGLLAFGAGYLVPED